jgi:hypothetical protein
MVPPSTTYSVPVMAEALFDARKALTFQKRTASFIFQVSILDFCNGIAYVRSSQHQKEQDNAKNNE